MTRAEKFMGLVDKTGPVIAPQLGACWMWTGQVRDNGYGSFRIGTGRGAKPGYAHRASWHFHRGDPGDSYVLHRCDNRLCVNPAHLYLGTHADNMRDMVVRGRRKGKGLGLRGRAKLTLKQVYEIEDRFFGGSDGSMQKIANDFGVTRQNVRCILRGKTWSNRAA